MASIPNSIRCFQHRECEPNVSCFKVPSFCPVCKESLKNAAFSVPPFCLPSPFCYSSEAEEKRTCQLLIKPTNGDFLLTYRAGDDLHIGVTDSTGKIYSFDNNGVSEETNGWVNCLSLKIIDPKDAYIIDKWNSNLKKQLQEPLWKGMNYNETSNNCCTFVLNFLNRVLKIEESKEAFIERYVLPVTTRAADYIAVYRQVYSGGFFIHH